MAGVQITQGAVICRRAGDPTNPITQVIIRTPSSPIM
jgi:hypothetical protein